MGVRNEYNVIAKYIFEKSIELLLSDVRTEKSIVMVIDMIILLWLSCIRSSKKRVLNGNRF